MKWALKFTYWLIYRLIFGSIRYARRIGVHVGEECRLYSTNFGSEPFLVKIGNRVTVTSGVKFLTHDGSVGLFFDHGKRYQRYAPVTIGNDVFIGVNSLIMPGVTIGNRVVIGAGSIVTKNIPDNSVFAGNPSQFLCTFDEYEAKVRRNCVSDGDLAKFSNRREKIDFAVSVWKEREDRKDDI